MTSTGKTAIAALLTSVALAMAAPIASAQESTQQSAPTTEEAKPAPKAGKPGHSGRQREAHQGNPMRDGMRGQRRMNGARGGWLVSLTCAPNAAERLETRLGRLADRLDLTDEQAGLFDELKTAALVAQTELSDSCPTPAAKQANQAKGSDMSSDEANADATQPTVSPIDRLEQRLTSESTRIAAMQELLPELRAFYESLDADQLTQLMPRRGQWHHRFDGRRGGDRMSDMAPAGADPMGG